MPEPKDDNGGVATPHKSRPLAASLPPLTELLSVEKNSLLEELALRFVGSLSPDMNDNIHLGERAIP